MKLCYTRTMDISIGTPQRLGHLPLVMDVYRRCGLDKAIDHAVPQKACSLVGASECVAVILSGVFVGAHSLWRLRERLEPYDMATVMQDPTFDLERFPEERLAKALDDLYAFGLDKLMTGVALHAIEQYRLDTTFLHFDTTSLSFYGSYEREDTWANLDGINPPPRVTYGHSKAHRPDLKQVLFGSLVTPDGGVPLWGQVMDGNASDSLAAAEFFKKIRSLVASPDEVCCVADSKGWCGKVLSVVATEGLRLLSRLPRTHNLHKGLMARTWVHPHVVEIPKGVNVDRYEYHGYDVEESFAIETANADGVVVKDVIQVPARAVRVYSTALLRTKLKTLDRVLARESRAAAKAIRDWQDCVYACEIDAQRAADRHVGQADWVTCDLHAEVTRHEGPAVRGRGRPRKRPEPALAGKGHWRVKYHTSPVDKNTTSQRLHDQACFILIRTRNDGWDIDDAEMISRYKDQFHVEHGFSWLKSGADINPMFLHTPHRIAALCFVYCLGLMIWNLIQRTVRKNLTKWKKGLPYHRRKLSANITTRFLFELFPSVQTIPITLKDGTSITKLAGFGEWQELAAKALGMNENSFLPVPPRKA
jgi:transposase